MLLDFADLTLTDKGQLYHQLYTYIKSAIEENAIKKGEKLPSVREAAAQLCVSRTTVENAYTKLCIEGVAESIPQRGYFIIGIPERNSVTAVENEKTEPPVIYDFSSRKVDEKASDTDLWKKSVRSVLWDSGELISYGDPQGEPGLRKCLADYSYKARGVVTSAENIVIGAGIGPLLNILCGLLGRNIRIGFENGGFPPAKQIFNDYEIECINLHSDRDGATIKDLQKSRADVLFLLPSSLPKISPTTLSSRRNSFCEWANKNSKHYIIEDDYNGELRYTARSVPAFQRNCPDSTIYIGSFSKLLLPSVRIAYMVLPNNLAVKFKTLSKYYNQTCGKIEQLALEKYIVSGALEKHLKKLRRLYYSKNQLLCRELENNFENLKAITIYESSLTVEVLTDFNIESVKLCEIAKNHGIKLMESPQKGSFRLCFAGISTEKIPNAILELNKIFGKLIF